MGFVLRHRFSVLLVLGAFSTAAGVFLFARPEYQPRYESEMTDFAKRRYYGVDAVRDAFVANGVRLRVASRFNGMLILSNEPRPLEADALHVILGPRRGTGSWGPRLEPYDERFGNVLVTYGGRDERLLDGVRASVAALR